MREEKLELIEKLTNMDEEERNNILKMFFASAEAVNGKGNIEEDDETTQDDNEEFADDAADSDDIDEYEECKDCTYREENLTKEELQAGGTLLAGTGVAAGLLGIALDNKTLKTAGLIGTIIGGAVILANKD